MGDLPSPSVDPAAGEPRPLAPGDRLGRFEVLRLLGRGGMGAVYEAYDPDLDRSVALKVLRSEREGGSMRLVREAQALAQLAHPNVVSVHDVGTEKGRLFIAMEYVDGSTLDEHLRASARSWKQVLDLFVQAGRGLAAAHARSIVHRDFKPANVLVDREGRVRVTDFGLARVWGEVSVDQTPGAPASGELDTFDGSESTVPQSPGQAPAAGSRLLSAPLTQADALLGTPRYMSPEQRARRPATETSDQYSFCVALWEAIFGELPPGRRRRAPGWLARALGVGLAHEPAARHPSMAHLLDILERTPVRRRRLAWASGAVAMLAALGGLALTRSTRAIACDRSAAQARLAGLWDADARRRVRAAFEATGKPYAADTFGRAERALDGRLDAWAAAHSEACAATHVRGEQSGALLDLRMACLERARRQLAALVDIWQHDPVELDRAVSAAVSVGDLPACADVQSLASLSPPPSDPAARRRVDELRRKLDVVDAMRRAGNFQPGLELSRQASAEAKAAGHAPTLAEALWLEGRLECDVGTLDKGLALLKDAARAAGEAHDDVTLARTMRDLVYYTGARAERFAEADAFVTAAEAALARVGGRPDLRADLLHAEGVLLDMEGKYPQALERLETALAVVEKLKGPDHPDVGMMVQAIAGIKYSLGQGADAIALYDKGIAIFERALGPNYPGIAVSLLNASLALEQEGDYARSGAYAERALALRETIYPKDHPTIAAALVLVGVTRRYQGRRSEARALFERAAAIRAKALPPDHPKHAEIFERIADVDMDDGDLAAARDRYERALAIKIKAYGDGHASTGTTLFFLGRVRLPLGDLAGARRAYEGALVAYRKSGSDVVAAWPLAGLGDVALAEGKPREALARFEEALVLETRRHAEDHPQMIGMLRGLGQAHFDLGQPAAARPFLERAGRLADMKIGDELDSAMARFQLARLRWATGERAAARELVRQAREALVTLKRPELAAVDRWVRDHGAR